MTARYERLVGTRVAASLVYRAPMRARDRDDVAQGAGADFGLEHGLVGTGDRLDHVPASLDEAVRAATIEHGSKAGRMLRAFAALPEGTFVWTRDSADGYVLGRITGPWRYEDGDAARRVGIHHVRPTRWYSREFGVHEVPAAVAQTFGRGGRNLQRIADGDATRATSTLWDRRGGG